MGGKPNAAIVSGSEPTNGPDTTIEHGTTLTDTGAVFSGVDIVDPATDFETAGTGTDTARRKPGRPRGSRNAAAATKTPKNLAGIESLLLSVHVMGAMMLSTPELALDPDEAKKLSDAIQNVVRFYPVGLSDKTLAWMNLGMVAGGIYGTRFVAVINKSRAERKKKPGPVPLITEQPATKPNGKAAPGPLTPSQLFGFTPPADGE